MSFVSLVHFVVEQRRRVEPRSAQRARKEDGKDRAVGLSLGEDVAGEMRPTCFQIGGTSGIPDRRRWTPWRLRGFAAYPLRVPGRCRAMKRRSHSGVRGGRGSVAPCGAWSSWGGGTQRSRAGLSSHGPPGPGPWLGKKLPRCIGIEPGSSPGVFDPDADCDPDTDAGAAFRPEEVASPQGDEDVATPIGNSFGRATRTSPLRPMCRRVGCARVRGCGFQGV